MTFAEFIALRKTPKKRQIPKDQKLILFASPSIIAGIALLVITLISFPFSGEQLRTMFHLQRHFVQTKGEITDAWVVRPEDEENYAIIAYEYIFYTPEIGQFKGVSYGENIIYPIGQSISVDYDPHEPYYNKASRLMVGRSKSEILILVLGIIFTSIGAIIYGIINTIYRLLYLERGELVMATRKSKKEFSDPDVGQDGDKMLSVVYQFKGSDGKDHYVAKVKPGLQKLKKNTPVVYLPDSPHKAKLIGLWAGPIASYAKALLRTSSAD